ncbi:Proton pump-interactor 1 [Carex littledalei]|uniref:Proton pump-interactor 1 n=1 Tax=Carex littledalei TaxID=544730 RepID=A0A833VSH6_9POAL|nr:Proton pump-interactor 1 [Carex littledalei]
MDLEQHKMNGEDNYYSNEMDFVHEADQWTEALPNQVDTFYFIKYRSHKDPKIMRNVAHFNFEIQRKGEEIDRLNEALKTIEVKHNSIRNILHVNSFWENYYGMVADSKSKELARIQDFLRKDAKNNRMKLHLSEEEELLKSIKTLNHHVQYKMMSAYEEKKLLKKIKEIEATRETIMANVYLEAKQNQEKEEKENQRLFNKIVDAPVKVWVKSQVKSIKIMKEMQLERMEKVKHFRKDLNALGTEIRLLKERINTANSKMEKAREVLLKTEKFRLEDYFHFVS